MLVETHDLAKRYRQVTALASCALEVERGEIFGLLGPNGSGKTTLLRLLVGFLRPSEGRATIDGLDCWYDSVAVHRRVSYLPAEAKLFRRMRGRDALAFFCRLRRDGSLARSLEIAERLGLELARPVEQMSTGMRQKLALSMALSPEVPLVILDEPTSSLDPSVRGEVLSLVRELQQAGRTVLFSSHVLSEVETVCDRVAILRQGRLAHTQVMSALRRQHRIHARLHGPLPAVPAEFNGALRIAQHDPEHVTIEADHELAPLLGWLATLPVGEMRIEPVGLQTVYDQYHRGAGR